MNRWKALTVTLLVVTLSGLIFGLVYLSKPAPALSYSSYAYKPGCHCGKPTATTAKKTATTAKKTTATTAKMTTPTTKKATTTATTAKKTSAKTTTATASTKRSTTTTKAKKSSKSTTSTKPSTTTTGDANGSAAEGDGDSDDSGALGAALGSFYDDGNGAGPGGSVDGSGDLSGLTAGEEVAAMSVKPPHYYFSPVAIGFLLVYAGSFALYRTKRMKVTTHRKIWNMLLMGTFLLCGILGLVLTVGVARSTPMQLPTWLLVWHVETGIAMCIISVFHIGWHARYYMAIATGKRRAARPAKAAKPERGPAVEGGIPKQRALRPALRTAGMSRSEEDRRLAYERRMAARGRFSPAS